MTHPHKHASSPLLAPLLTLLLILTACVEEEATRPSDPQAPPALNVSPKPPGHSGIYLDPPLANQLALGTLVPNVLARQNAPISPKQWTAFGVEVVREFPALGLVHLKALGPAHLQRMEQGGGVVALYVEQMLEHDGQAAAMHIGQPLALGRGVTGQGVGIAILDTGVDFEAADFGGCTAPGAPAGGCQVAQSVEIAPDDGARDDDGHGTNVAAIAAQVAPGAAIVALDVFAGPQASSIDVIAGLDWVVANQSRHSIRVVNLSVGSGRHTTACDLGVFAQPIAQLHALGIHVVTSAGNEGFGDAVGSPGCVTRALTVGAAYGFDIPSPVDYGVCKDAAGKKGAMACFSNASPSLDLVAPGVGLEGGGHTFTGTSQAAPVAAGALALLAEAYPTEGVQQREARLLRHRGQVDDPRTGKRYTALSLSDAFDAPGCGYGLILKNGESWAAAGEARQVEVRADCGWQLELDQLPWITPSVLQGQGAASVALLGQPNPHPVRRRGMLRLRDGQGQVVGEVEVIQEGNQAAGAKPQAVAMRVFFDLAATPIVQVPVQVVSERRGFEIARICLSTKPECGQWVPYEEWSWVELPPGDGVKTVYLNVVSTRGERLERPVRKQVRLDTVAPEDGRVSITSLPGQGVKLSWQPGRDSAGEVVAYRVVWSASVLPKNCAESPQVSLLYQGGEREVVHRIGGHDFSQVYYRVCAMDEAFHHSPGVAASYGGPF